MYQHTSAIMFWSKAVPESNGPVPQQEEFRSDQPTLVDVYRIFEERFDRQLEIMDELVLEMRATEQRSASLEHNTRQRRLAMKADVASDT